MFNNNEGTPYEQHTKRFKFSGRQLKKWLVIALVVLLFVLLRALINLKLDYTWFDVLGYGTVFWRTIAAKAASIGIIFSLAFILSLLNCYLVYKLSKRPFKALFAVPVAVVIALLVSANGSQLWLTMLRTFYAEPFGINDPQFALDIGFYVFRLPLFWLIYRLGSSLLFLNLIATTLLYLTLFPRAMEMSARNVTTRILSGVEKTGLLHAGGIIGFLIVWQAFQYKLSTYELLYSQAGSVIGAGAADIGARLLGYYFMIGLSLLLGLYIIVTFKKQIRKSLYLIIGYFIITIIATGVFPGLYQKFVVDPDELGKEIPYLERNIEYTRLAYGLNNLTEVEYPSGEITAEELSKERDVIDNIRLLDHRATKSTYAQQQEIRLYYDFIDVDVDRYVIYGKKTQVLLSARELNRSSLPEQAQTFNNLMFKYTHGFGLVMSPANAITTAGLPQYIIKDIPPKSTELLVTEPRIYFGETSNDSVIVNTGLMEFDYPMGENNQEYSYQGDKGIPMSFLNKLFLTARDAQIKYLLSNYITNESQYLETRNVAQRAARIAPFLLYDRDPYLTLGKDGKLYYIIDAYTLTDKYPYSQAVDQAESFNYIRNSVKVIVDAYSGEINYYIFDENDPIAKVYKNIFPELFKPAADFPEDLREHIRYPEDLFTVQSLLLRDYHMSNTTVFYNREDRWEFAKEAYWGELQPQEPYYSIIRLPEEEKTEFVLMRSFTPSGKQNMVSWLSGRSDGENYGKLLLYKFPKGKQIAGTTQVDSLIDQDPVISSQLTLWGQGGSNVLRGNLLVYPVAGSLLYVEPLYIESEQNKYPQLKKVFVYYNDVIVMEDTLEKALETIFGRGSTTQPSPGLLNPAEDETIWELIERLAELNKASKEKLKAGDWAGYGQLQEEVDRIIDRLETGAKA